MLLYGEMLEMLIHHHSVKENISLKPFTVLYMLTFIHELLKLINCTRDKDTPCKTTRCGHHNANMAYTESCAVRAVKLDNETSYVRTGSQANNMYHIY
jgi:hypothetical protein